MPFATGGLPLRVMRCLGPLGARFTLVSTEPKNVARSSTYCTRFIVTPPQTEEESLARLMRLDVGSAFPVLLPVTTKGFAFAARHRAVLATRFLLPPLAAEEDLQLASDKWRLHDLCRRHGLPVLPAVFLSASVAADLARGAVPFRFPALIKPSLKENGGGIRKVDSAEALGALYLQTPGIAGGEALLQTFVEGDDVSLSAYCEGGEIKAHTLWRTLVSSSVPYTIPTCIQFVRHPDVLEIGRRLLRLLRWEGVCDIDFLVDRRSAEIWILEVNARFWGNVISCAKGGVNFPLLMTAAAEGDLPPAWPVQLDGTVFCFARGVRRGLRLAPVRRALVAHPLRSTALVSVARDVGPELRRVQARLGRLWLRCIRRTPKPDPES